LIFTETKIKGIYIIEPEFQKDDRGFFARSFCKEEFRNHGLEIDIVQCSISFNKKKGTLRGMHYQTPPFEETKIVSCPKGSIFDVAVDLRTDSPTYCKWVGTDLSDKNCKMMYIPKGCAHGFQTLADDSMVYYQMTDFFHPEYARGILWNDPLINIEWKSENPIMSEKDKLFGLCNPWIGDDCQY
jgi:dTDP-4-dehydrorhamnose 3,5-epimerase